MLQIAATAKRGKGQRWSEPSAPTGRGKGSKASGSGDPQPSAGARSSIDSAPGADAGSDIIEVLRRTGAEQRRNRHQTLNQHRIYRGENGPGGIDTRFRGKLLNFCIEDQHELLLSPSEQHNLNVDRRWEVLRNFYVSKPQQGKASGSGKQR